MKRLLFLLCVLVPMVWLVGLVWFDYKINNIDFDKETKTDAIVVLTGGRHRLSEAIDLLNKGMSDKLFISGVQKDISLKELGKRYNVELVTNEKIILDRIATNTFENARETSLWIDKKSIKSIRLVTSNYHVLRSVVEFRRWNRNIRIIVHPVFSEKVATSWWKSLYSFCFLAREYNKFLFALVRAYICSV